MKKGLFIAIYIGFILLCSSSCGALTKSRLKSETATAVNGGTVSKTDSSGIRSTGEIWEKTREIIYRDTPIYLPGNPYPVYLPASETTKESGARKIEEQSFKNTSDSGWLNVIQYIEESQKQKERTALPVVMIVTFSLLALCLICIILMFIKYRKLMSALEKK